jgi:hypothetical protein
MVLNVKLQGLKYNYEKVQGCFCKIPRFQRFLGLMELFSLRKIHRICPQHRGPVHRRWLTGLRTSLNASRWLPDQRLGLNQANRYLGF